ncbi:hypothetical protein IEZ26_01525 [Nocardioides cavernae]|uniref:DUF1801 domain-containing protein n=1 Tax=Nocardioides cavernae TaxID=1921566 RepID=A0ABR8N7R6_9ACTN|nr:hypothetical protein [Nocardioides cavernae]MBD3923286.1 hypothetical protein [Nocardioides cavernae]MBM7511792.1 hypothetical protein [Nocardioides cavernae]
MTEAQDFTPAEIVVGLDHYAVLEPMRRLVREVASQRSITADPPGKGYVAVRPAVWGNVSAYFHKTYVDVAVSPGMAEKLHRSRGWKLVKTNGETGFVRIDADALSDMGTRDLAVQTLLAAVDKSEAGTAYEGGRPKATQAQTNELCSTHFLAMVGGRCDACE